MSFCPDCAARLSCPVATPALCLHEGTGSPASPVVSVDVPPLDVARAAAERAAEVARAAEARADHPARPREADAGYRPPPELVELGDIFSACHERVARALAVEPDLADPLDGMRGIGDALTALTADLRTWHHECASPTQRRVTPEAAAELAAMVHGARDDRARAKQQAR